MPGQFETHQRKKMRLMLPCILIGIGVLLWLLIGAYYMWKYFLPPEPQLQAQPSTVPSGTVATQPTQPPIIKQSTATIGATGDLLLHDKVIKSGYNSETGTYNFESIFSFFAPYVSQLDYAVANLEVTLCGEDNGYKYSGYPCFNAPDAIVDAAKAAGFDMLLTANNHCFDTGTKGFFRTQQVVTDRGLDYIGTRDAVEKKNYTVKEINGIRIGMICYTYNTGFDENGKVSLNGISLTQEASALVNSFNYKNLDGFYEKLSGELAVMRADGAEAVMLYIHWGDEYQIQANSTQKKMAQELCDLGIDVIVGNHAHVPQPVELLTNTKDASKKTLCLYSTGNAISNIRVGPSYPPESEDGMLFTVTFAKYSDGTVIVESADILPTWVNRYFENGKTEFKILTMDPLCENQWRENMGLTHDMLKVIQDSYARTMKIVGQGLETANAYYGENQKQVEKSLKIAE